MPQQCLCTKVISKKHSPDLLTDHFKMAKVNIHKVALRAPDTPKKGNSYTMNLAPLRSAIGMLE
jgi:hypothetical protein